MGNYTLSRKADQDVSRIYEYSIENFGLDQAIDYLLALHNRFELLAENQQIGRTQNGLQEGLRRFEFKRHVIFYTEDKKDILIVRVLGAEQLPEKHLPG